MSSIQFPDTEVNKIYFSIVFVGMFSYPTVYGQNVLMLYEDYHNESIQGILEDVAIKFPLYTLVAYTFISDIHDGGIGVVYASGD